MGLSAAGVLGFALAPHLIFAKEDISLARILKSAPLNVEPQKLVQVGFLVEGGKITYIDYFHAACGSFERVFTKPQTDSYTCSGCGKEVALTGDVLDDVMSNKEIADNKTYAGLLVSNGNAQQDLQQKQLLAAEVGPAGENGNKIAIIRSALCQTIDNREPAHSYSVEQLKIEAPVTYFIEAAAPGLTTTINHVWRLNGKIINSIPLIVSGGRWRTWSNKEILDPGYWSVSSETLGGDILDVKHFAVTA